MSQPFAKDLDLDLDLDSNHVTPKGRGLSAFKTVARKHDFLHKLAVKKLYLFCKINFLHRLKTYKTQTQNQATDS
jgi:hypothetical protein